MMKLIRLVYAVQGRVARPASVRTNLVKTLVQSLSLWLVFLLIAPNIIYKLETRMGLGPYRLKSSFWRPVGGALFVVGWAIAWASAIVMVVEGKGTPLPIDAPREFVVVGPYRYMRNPMAAGSILQGVAVGLFLRSPLVVAYALLGSVTWNYLARPWEEMDLERRFGPPYAQYHAGVRCWIPRLTPYNPNNN